MTLADTGRFIKESTTAFLGRMKGKGVGNSSILVGGFIGSASTANEIIEKGIRGEPLNFWHGLKFLFFFGLACCHSYGLWKADPKGPAEFIGKVDPTKIDPEGHLR